MSLHGRGDFPVLVPEAHAMGSIAVIRSLGRAGYPVHAVSARRDALGLRSRYAAARAICPAPGEGALEGWLRAYVGKHGIRAIVPSEALIMELRDTLPEWLRLMPVPQDPGRLLEGLSKVDVHERFAGAAGTASRLPPSLVSRRDALPSLEELSGLGPPLFCKVDACYDEEDREGRVHRAGTPAEARDLLQRLHGRYASILVQGFVAGCGVGAFLLRWRGRELARFMHRRLHEVPHTGGASSFRESYLEASILEDARMRLEGLDWEGAAMLEYRRDEATGDFHFVELNARFWGSLHLALFAGVDFPLLLLDAFRGEEPEAVSDYPTGVRCRLTFPRDAQYVWSRLKDRRLGILSRLWSVVEFPLLGLDPRVRSDLLFRGDRRLYFLALARFAAEAAGGLAARLRRAFSRSRTE